MNASAFSSNGHVPDRVCIGLISLGDANTVLEHVSTHRLSRPLKDRIVDWVVEDIFRLQAMESLLRTGQERPCQLELLSVHRMPCPRAFHSGIAQPGEIACLPGAVCIGANIVDGVVLPRIEAR